MFLCYFFVLSKEKMSTSKSCHTVIKLICVLNFCDVCRGKKTNPHIWDWHSIFNSLHFIFLLIYFLSYFLLSCLKPNPLDPSALHKT